MKNLSLLLTLVMMQFVAHAQDAVVSPVKMNVLYLGISNPVEIAVPGITSDKVTATTNNGTINRTATGWEIIPGNLNECIVSVFSNNKKVADKTFRVKSIPAPIAVFAGFNSGTTLKENAAKNGRLEAKIIDFDWDLKFNIVSFTMLIKNGAVDKELVAKGNTLTEEMKSQISELTRGQSITFKDIKVLAPDGKIKELNPIIITIE
jgi:gliding motility-associated protein GldM